MFERRITRLPLLPLSDAVHFPRTDLWVKISDPGYQARIEELLRGREERLVGTVLLRPDPARQPAEELFTAGTAGRLIDFEYLEDGGVSFVLRGEFRFEVRRILGGGEQREAEVEPVPEPFVSEIDPDVMALREELLECSASLAQSLGERFPLASDHLLELGEGPSFEELVNSLASHLDLTPVRKQQLLINDLPGRALELRSILRSRRRILELLDPYRHLAVRAEEN